jgi:hypothetical protein
LWFLSPILNIETNYVTLSGLASEENNNKRRLELEITTVLDNNLAKKIDAITNYLSRQYFNTILKKLAIENNENATTICNYIITEQNEINIKDSTKEGKIKVLVWLSNFHNDKSFKEMTKQDILSYLNGLRKPAEQGNGWINSYNNRQMVFLKFFKWLYNQDEPDLVINGRRCTHTLAKPPIKRRN